MMSNDNLIAFFRNAIDKKYLLKKKWILNMFSYIVDKNYTDEWITIKDNVVTDNDTGLILSKKYTAPIFDTSNIITIPKSFIHNKEKIDTTIGRLVMNCLYGFYALNGKIDYINKLFKVGDIEYMLPKLMTEDTANKITISEYKSHINTVLYVTSFTKLLGMSATVKAITPPKGFDEFLKKAIAELKIKYDVKEIVDPRHVAELESMALKYDAEWLKDDASNNKLLNKKIKNMARKRMFLLFGIGNTFDEVGTPILTPLKDGWGKDRDKLAVIFNDSRAGSYGRGVETQQGGSAAKDSLRATSGIKILNEDCGSKVTIKTLITKDNKKVYSGRYRVVNGVVKIMTDDELDKLVDTVIDLRTSRGCKASPDFCKVCLGENKATHPNGVSLMVSGATGDMVKLALAKFHGNTLTLVPITLEDIW